MSSARTGTRACASTISSGAGPGGRGDPGTSRFFVSLEDDLFERYGLARRLFARYRLERQTGAVDNDLLRKEDPPRPARHRGPEPGHPPGSLGLLDARRNAEKHRRRVAGCRLQPDGRGRTLRSVLRRELLAAGTTRLGRQEFDRIVRRATLFHIDAAWSDHLAWLADLREGIHLVSIGRKEPLQEFQKAATEVFLELEDKIGGVAEASLRSLLAREGPVDIEAAGLKGPSSTWTYLVNDDQFGWGVGLLKGSNIGFAAGAAAFYGPLFLLALFANRFKKRRGQTQTF